MTVCLATAVTGGCEASLAPEASYTVTWYPSAPVTAFQVRATESWVCVPASPVGAAGAATRTGL